MSRYRKFVWKTCDGKPVPENVEVSSEHVDLEIEHDVVDPRAVMEYLRLHPGRRFVPELKTERSVAVIGQDYTASEMSAFLSLDSIISVSTRLRYQPYCARTIRRVTTFNEPLSNVRGLDVIYMHSWGRESKMNTFFYIPKMKKMTLKGFNGAPDAVCDMSAGVVMPEPPWKVNTYATKDDCTDPEDMPDRFIRIGGPADRRIDACRASEYRRLVALVAV